MRPPYCPDAHAGEIAPQDERPEPEPEGLGTCRRCRKPSVLDVCVPCRREMGMEE